MAEKVIELKNVSVELGGELILNKINLSVYPGETIVLIGPSGGGKTVLLKTMAGVYTPSEGQVLCYGHEWASLSMAGKHDLAAKVGMQFQKYALFDDLNVYDNVAFPLREHGITDENDINRRVLQSLESVNLTAAKKLFPHEISGGMKQRLGIARAIVLTPEIIFMDDPTAGLDPVNSDQMADLILDIKNKQHATLIIVTHDMLRAYQLAGRIILVADQGIVETGNEEETRNHPDPRVQQFIHGRIEGPLKILS